MYLYLFACELGTPLVKYSVYPVSTVEISPAPQLPPLYPEMLYDTPPDPGTRYVYALYFASPEYPPREYPAQM